MVELKTSDVVNASARSTEHRIHLDHLAVWRIVPQETPRARVLIVHGICEHSKRHQNTVDALVLGDYEVIRFDLRGAGESGGERQWISSFNDYVSDISLVHSWICSELDDLPLFLLGHSLGGAIAIEFASRYGEMLQGLVLSAPAYRTGAAISQLTIWIGRRLVRFFPKLRVPSAPDHSSLSRDPAIGEAYATDPLVCRFNTLQQGNEILNALPTLPVRCVGIRCPTLIVHGTSDRVVLCEGSFELFAKLTTKDKTFHVLPGGYHEPHNDIERDQYFELLLRWLDAHLPKQ